MVKLEKQHVSVNSSSYVSQHSITSSISMSGSNSTGQMSYNSLRTFNQATGETSGVVNSYLLFHSTSGDDSGTVTFDGEIIGIFWDVSYIHSNLNSSTNSSSNASTVRSLYNNSSLSYETNALPGLVMENNGTGTGNSYTYRYGNSSNTNYDNDRVAVTSSGGTNNKLHMRVSDGNGGDYIRVIVKVNVDPSAVADTGYIQEGKTLTVANSGSAVAGTTTGSNTGDITDNDTDANNDSLTVTHIQHSGAGSSTSVTNVTYNHGSATSVSGTYGTLTIGSDGSYQYVASSDINNLDAGEANVTDVFTYTVSDGNGGTDTETLTINVIPSQDLTARNDTGTVNEDATLTVADGDNANSATALSLIRTTSINSQESYPRDVTFNNDGTKMFTIGATGDDIGYYTLSTAYDTSTATHQADYLGSTYTTAWSLSFNNDGKKLFIVNGDSSYRIYEYSLTTAYDLSTLSLESNRGPFSFSSSYPTGHSFNSDGTKLFLGNTDGGIREYSLSVGFDLSSTFTLVDTLDVSSDVGNNVKGIEFTDDGTKMFVSSESARKLYQYDLSTGFDLTGATLKKELFHNVSYINGFEFKPDGSQLFLAKSANGSIYTYDVESPYELKDVNDTHSGDVIHTNSTDNYDTDPDSDTLNRYSN